MDSIPTGSNTISSVTTGPSLNPETDLDINVTQLEAEFRHFPAVFYRYYKEKAKLSLLRDTAKAKLKEVRALAYKSVKADSTIKHTEKSIEAEVEIHPTVLEAQKKLLRAEHDAATIDGVVDSMSAKKDMLMQLGAHSRKER